MKKLSTGVYRLAAVTAAAATLAGAAGCSRNDLLGVVTPDIVTPGNANNTAGAQGLRAAAIGWFNRLVGGDYAGSSPLGLNLTTGLLGDEIISARNGTEPLDQRGINPNNFPIDTWTAVGTAHTQIVRAINALKQYPPATGASTQLGQLYAYHGYMLLMTAEAYCNGIPLATTDGTDQQTTTYDNTQLYRMALAAFDTAATTLGSSTSATDVSLKNLVTVGRARTYLDLNKPDSAAVYAAAVPSGFSYGTEFSTLTTSLNNGVYDWMVSTRNFGASDKEGTNGLDYVSSGDPRIKVDRNTKKAGQDGTQVYVLSQYPAPNTPVVYASYTEAQLIVAENQMRNGDYLGMTTTLNALRAGTSGLTPLAVPASATAAQDMLFRERAFWMYLTGHRLGDMRRLVWQYGRDPETVYPTGAYFKGGNYGTDVVLVPSQTEQNNPNWKGCSNRTAGITGG